MSDKAKQIAQALSSFCSCSRYATDAELAVTDHASGGVRDDGESLPYLQNRAYKWLTRSNMCEKKDSCGHTGFVICGIPLPIFMGILRECRYQSIMQSKNNTGIMYALETLGKPYKALVALQVDDETKKYWVITVCGPFRASFYGMLLAGATGNNALAGMVDIRPTSKQSRQADGFGDSFYDNIYALHGELRYRQGHMYFTRSTGSEAECKTVVANDGTMEGTMEKRLPSDIERVLLDRTVAKAKVVITGAGRDGHPTAQYYLINKHRTSEGQRRIYLVVSSAEGLFTAANVFLKAGESRVFLRSTNVLSRWKDGMKDEMFSTGYAAHVNREMLKDAGISAAPQGVPVGPRPVRPMGVGPRQVQSPPVRPPGSRGPAAPHPTMPHAHSEPLPNQSTAAPPPGPTSLITQAKSYMKENPAAARMAEKLTTGLILLAARDVF